MGSDADREALGRIVRDEAGLVLASLIATFGDFDLAEDAFQDAVATALERWPREGAPQRPAAWLTTVARRRAIDRLRHEAMREGKAGALRASERLRRAGDAARDAEEEGVPDERLRLLFTCCHPALPPDAPRECARTQRASSRLRWPARRRASARSFTVGLS